MTIALLVGAAAGLAVVLVLGVLLPARPSLELVLDRIHRPPIVVPSGRPGQARGRIARAIEASAPGAVLTRSVRHDLRVVGMAPADYVLRRLGWGTGGAVVSAGLGVFALSLGVSLPVGLVVTAAAGLGALGFMVPMVTVRSTARARREDFAYSLSGFVDLMAVALAGGLGVEEALETCAATGQGWAFAELRRALAQAQLRNEAPWDAFDRLAGELGVPDLAELAASVTLAGKDGSRITVSITAKAKAMRGRAQARVEARANSASELMSLPLMLLLMGMVLFVAYPATVSITGGLHP